MYVTLVHVHVVADHIDDFVTASQLNHQNSIKEPGCLRFDVLQEPEDSSRFILYEAYKTVDDAAAHKTTAHYLQWRDTVADWMASPRKGIAYSGLLPK